MPELAEVEYYRQKWNPGFGARIKGVKLHPKKRIFRGLQTSMLKEALPGKRLLRSEAHGKQMLFRFSGGLWLGLHLGMTGELRIERPSFAPGKHDHLALYQQKQALIFSDPRQFGRVRLHVGPEPPEWWSDLPPSPVSKRFTPALMGQFLESHRKLSLKAALLLQQGFPGIGNWMADEILWRACLDPRRRAATLNKMELKALWHTVRFVSREAIKSLRKGYSALPPKWLFHERWKREGNCPTHRNPLCRETVGGRTTVWCEKCQTTSSSPPS